MNGVLLVNKERGIGSTQVVSKVRKLLNTKEVGHCGTLDPLAEGLLVLTIGKALKISQYLEANEKEYITTLTLGKTTATLDAEGEFIETKDITPFKKDGTVD
jgi:tRNA pseudouridine55 synthase